MAYFPLLGGRSVVRCEKSVRLLRNYSSCFTVCLGSYTLNIFYFTKPESFESGKKTFRSLICMITYGTAVLAILVHKVS